MAWGAGCRSCFWPQFFDRFRGLAPLNLNRFPQTCDWGCPRCGLGTKVVPSMLGLGGRAFLTVSRFGGRRGRVVVGVVFLTGMTIHRVGGLDSAFGSKACVQLAVAVLERELILGQCLIALAL